VVLQWRNDPDSRKGSRDQGVIPLDTHQVWFDQVLVSPERSLLIGENAHGEPIGQVRFDRMTTGVDSYEVSIAVAPESRGQGLALPLLAAAEVYFLDVHGSAQLHAYVDRNNKASEHLFGNAGYTIKPLTDANGQWWIKGVHV
jgi:RimJ/RimL family protein N-acetyltransferase